MNDKPSDVRHSRKGYQYSDQLRALHNNARLGRNRVEKELAWPHEALKLLAAYAVAFNSPHTKTA